MVFPAALALTGSMRDREPGVTGFFAHVAERWRLANELDAAPLGPRESSMPERALFSPLMGRLR
jgi:hypothetical protein